MLVVSYILYGLLGFVFAAVVLAAPMFGPVDKPFWMRVLYAIFDLLMGATLLMTVPAFKRCLQRCPRLTSNTDKWLTDEECAEIADASDWGGKQPTADQFNMSLMLMPLTTAFITHGR